MTLPRDIKGVINNKEGGSRCHSWALDNAGKIDCEAIYQFAYHEENLHLKLCKLFQHGK